jgi:hypothetical protein
MSSKLEIQEDKTIILPSTAQTMTWLVPRSKRREFACFGFVHSSNPACAAFAGYASKKACVKEKNLKSYI